MSDDENKLRSDDEWREDEALADMLMSGFAYTQKNGSLATGYIKKNSKEERASRMAMARLLRSGRPFTQDFRNRLAAFFDGGPGRRRDHVKNTAVAEFVYDCIRGGDKPVKAQEKAAVRFGMSPHTVRDIWGHGKTRKGLRELLEQIARTPPGSG